MEDSFKKDLVMAKVETALIYSLGHTAAWKSACLPFGDPLASLHCLPQTPDSNAYSQVQLDISADGEAQAKSFAIRRQLSFEIQDLDITDFHPVQKPEFTLVIPHDSHLSSTSLYQDHAGQLGLISFAYFGLSHSSLKRFDCLHVIAWHTEDQTVVISPKIPRKNNCQSQDLNPQLFTPKLLRVKPVGVKISVIFLLRGSKFYSQQYVEKEVLVTEKGNPGVSKHVAVWVKRTFTLTLKSQNVEAETHGMPRISLWPCL